MLTTKQGTWTLGTSYDLARDRTRPLIASAAWPVVVLARVLAAGVLVLMCSTGLDAQVVVDHASVAQFAKLTPIQVTAARALKMAYVDRSVGFNQWQGLSACLAVPVGVSPSFCRRNSTTNPVPARELTWTGSYPVPHWTYYQWPVEGNSPLPAPGGCPQSGVWYRDIDCFLRWAGAHADEFDVVQMQFSYLDVGAPGIESSSTGFFARGNATHPNIADWEAVAARHPQTKFTLATTSLARDIGTSTASTFNAQVRAYARTHKVPLLDVADIESHAPDGTACVGNLSSDAAICQHYTSEAHGGHLGRPSAGMIRIAKAWWVFMVTLAASGHK